jgi:hypothetical protein
MGLFFVLFFVCVCIMCTPTLGLELRTFQSLGRCPTTESHPYPCSFLSNIKKKFFLKYRLNMYLIK